MGEMMSRTSEHLKSGFKAVFWGATGGLSARVFAGMMNDGTGSKLPVAPVLKQLLSSTFALFEG